jgi:hypothetical protein
MRRGTRSNVWLWVLLGTACGGDGPAEGAGGETGGNDATASATAATSTAATASESATAATSSAESGEGSGGSETTSPGDSSGGSTTGPEGPGIELGCMGIGEEDVDDGVICFYDVEGAGKEPAANLVYKLVDLDGTPAIYLRLIFAPWFCDNTYGVNAINWSGGHKFNDLVGSDHADFELKNVAGETVLQFTLDYIDDDETADSGYSCMGVWGGEGSFDFGNEAAILAANSSLSRNLNERGYGDYLVDSPATDENYTPNAATPAWDYRVIYEVWLDRAAFADEGPDALAEACVQFIHASPSKLEDNTLEVIPDSCPPGWGCFEEDGCQCDSSVDPDGSDPCDPGSGYPEG